MQSYHFIGAWASNNLMKLNAKKCKEMLICSFRNKPYLPCLCVGEQVLEFVSSQKVLGLIIQEDFTWNEHVAMIVTKASKRLHMYPARSAAGRYSTAGKAIGRQYFI
jgi:hypothetical protein